MWNTISQWLLNEYGLVGIVMITLAFVIIYLVKDGRKERDKMHKEHLAERKEWKDTSDLNFNTMLEVTKDNTSVLKGIEKLIESMDRRSK